MNFIEKIKKNLSGILFIIFSLFSYIWLNYLLYHLINLKINMWYVTTPILLLLHILLLRFITLRWIYEWQFPVQCINLYFSSVPQAKANRTQLLKMKEGISVLLELTGGVQRSHINAIKQGILKVSRIIEQFADVVERYRKLSKKQTEAYQAFLNLDNDMGRFGFKEYFTNLNTLNLSAKTKCEWKLSAKNQISNAIYKYKLLQINLDLRIVIDLLDEFICERYGLLSFTKWKNIFNNDAFCSIEKIHCDFIRGLSDFTIEEHRINHIQYMLVKSDSKFEEDDEPNPQTKSKTLLIMCCPNGGPYELGSLTKCNFFLSNSIDLLLWNYRGYGFSKGKATFNRSRRDIELVYDDVVRVAKYEKIGVYGYSIGGVAAMHLAAVRKVDVLISDRNFASISDAAYGLKYGLILLLLFKMICVRSDRTMKEFFKAKCPKIVLCSPSDSLIMSNATIKTGISRYVMKNCIEGSTTESALEFLIGKNDMKIFIDNIFRVLVYVKNVQRKSEQDEEDEPKEANQINSMNVGSSTKVYDKLIDDEHNEDIILTTANQSIKDDDLINECLYNFIHLFTSSCTENIDYCVKENLSMRRTKIMLQCLFDNILVWGCRTVDEPNAETFLENVTNKMFDPALTLALLNKAESELSKIVNSVKYSNNEIITAVNALQPIMKKMIDNYHLLIPKNEVIDSNALIPEEKKEEKSMRSIIEKLQCYLIRLKCGHNGLATPAENDVLLYYLKKAKFI